MKRFPGFPQENIYGFWPFCLHESLFFFVALYRLPELCLSTCYMSIDKLSLFKSNEARSVSEEKTSKTQPDRLTILFLDQDNAAFNRQAILVLSAFTSSISTASPYSQKKNTRDI
jgi:hypothetical protein